MRNKHFNISILALLLLTGCDKVRETLNLNRSQPDEFNVLERRPLTIPPGYGLRPPVAGEQSPGYIDPHAKAEEAIGGKKHTSGKRASAVEQALLEKANTKNKHENIRDVVDQENPDQDQSIGEKMVFWRSNPKNNKDLIDPTKEYEEHYGHEHPSKYIEEAR